jgi:hypothetical protein
MSLYVFPPVSLSIASAPTSFVKDNINVTVTENDSDVTQNKPLPSKLFIEKDGESIPVNKDSVTAANTVAIPVEIVAVDGAEINITAGDINVQTSHTGVNFDSQRIGNGTNLLDVNASGEALVNDALSHTKLDAVIAKDFATEVTLAALLAKIIAAPSTEAKQDLVIAELEKKADLTETQPVSVAALPLPSGSSTEAKQDDNIAELVAIKAIDFSTETTQAAVSGKLTTISDNIISLLNTAKLSISRVVGPILPASTQIPKSSSLPLEIVASTTKITRKIQTIEDVGEFIGLYIGAASSETLHCILPLAGGEVDLNLPVGTRLSIRHMKDTNITSSTFFSANLFWDNVL